MQGKFLFLLLLLSPVFAFAQPQVVSWDFSAEKAEGDTVTVTITGTIDAGWYVYSQYLEEDGPIATKVSFDQEEELTLIGKSEENGGLVDGYDEIFMMEIKKYKNEMIITQQLLLPEGEKYISGNVLFMSCDHEQCLPPSEAEFSLLVE
jgi:thiol:disulfide interchange protein DsbD